MNLVSVKTESDIKLEGIKAKFSRQDGTIRCIELEDSNGSYLRIDCDYGTRVLIKSPPKKIKRHRVTTTASGCGLTFPPELFDNQYEASARKNAIEATLGSGCEVTIDEIEVDEVD